MWMLFPRPSTAPDEVLVYPRRVEIPDGAPIDNSAVIRFFLVGQDFTERTRHGSRVYRITRISREGIWGTPKDTENP